MHFFTSHVRKDQGILPFWTLLFPLHLNLLFVKGGFKIIAQPASYIQAHSRSEKEGTATKAAAPPADHRGQPHRWPRGHQELIPWGQGRMKGFPVSQHNSLAHSKATASMPRSALNLSQERNTQQPKQHFFFSFFLSRKRDGFRNNCTVLQTLFFAACFGCQHSQR